MKKTSWVSIHEARRSRRFRQCPVLGRCVLRLVERPGTRVCPLPVHENCFVCVRVRRNGVQQTAANQPLQGNQPRFTQPGAARNPAKVHRNWCFVAGTTVVLCSIKQGLACVCAGQATPHISRSPRPARRACCMHACMPCMHISCKISWAAPFLHEGLTSGCFTVGSSHVWGM